MPRLWPVVSAPPLHKVVDFLWPFKPQKQQNKKRSADPVEYRKRGKFGHLIVAKCKHNFLDGLGAVCGKGLPCCGYGGGKIFHLHSPLLVTKQVKLQRLPHFHHKVTTKLPQIQNAALSKASIGCICAGNHNTFRASLWNIKRVLCRSYELPFPLFTKKIYMLGEIPPMDFGKCCLWSAINQKARITLLSHKHQTGKCSPAEPVVATKISARVFLQRAGGWRAAEVQNYAKQQNAEHAEKQNLRHEQAHIGAPENRQQFLNHLGPARREPVPKRGGETQHIFHFLRAPKCAVTWCRTSLLKNNLWPTYTIDTKLAPDSVVQGAKLGEKMLKSGGRGSHMPIFTDKEDITCCC